jgi:hypothetical protein
MTALIRSASAISSDLSAVVSWLDGTRVIAAI